jgi:hypothetical protein
MHKPALKLSHARAALVEPLARVPANLRRLGRLNPISPGRPVWLLAGSLRLHFEHFGHDTI